MEDLFYIGIFALIVYGIYWVVVHVLIPLAAVFLAVLVIIAIIAAITGLFYGMIMSAYNYVDAINRTFGERIKNG